MMSKRCQGPKMSFRVARKTSQRSDVAVSRHFTDMWLKWFNPKKRLKKPIERQKCNIFGAFAPSIKRTNITSLTTLSVTMGTIGCAFGFYSSGTTSDALAAKDASLTHDSIQEHKRRFDEYASLTLESGQLVMTMEDFLNSLLPPGCKARKLDRV
jgi:hypothetical protein